MATTKTVVTLPLRGGIAPADFDAMKLYIDECASIIAQSLGYVVREDLTAEKPSYATNSYIKFLAPDAQSAPDFTVANWDNHFDFYRINVVNYISGIYQPYYYGDYINNYNQWLIKTQVGAQWSVSNTNDKVNRIETLTFDDGRKLVSFLTCNADLTDYYVSGAFSILIGNGAYVDGTKYTKPILFAARPVFPYIDSLEFIDNFGDGDNFTWLDNTSNIYAQLGFSTGSANTGKESLINISAFWIGTTGRSYIPGLSRFTNRQGARPGKKVIIKNEAYYIVSWGGSNKDALVIPEEV